jgi:hypothetical protein
MVVGTSGLELVKLLSMNLHFALVITHGKSWPGTVRLSIARTGTSRCCGSCNALCR